MSISVEQEVNGLISLLVIQFSLQLANNGSYEKAYKQAKKDLTDKLGLKDWQAEDFLNLVVVPQVSVEKGQMMNDFITLKARQEYEQRT